MKTLLKNNIWIESLNHKDWTLYDEYIDLVIYSGKVSDIPDECIIPDNVFYYLSL